MKTQNSIGNRRCLGRNITSIYPWNKRGVMVLSSAFPACAQSQLVKEDETGHENAFVTKFGEKFSL